MTAISIFLAYALVGAVFRLGWGGLLRKWQAHVLAGLMAASLVLVCWWFNQAPWQHAAIVGAATWVQWASPSRDFASSRSLLEAHGPWACVSAAALSSLVPLLGPVMVVAGYYAFQRWWPDRPGWFWKPTVCAEAWAGAWVWGCAAMSLAGI